MLLYIFKDGSVKQVEDNPTTADILGVATGMLSIYKKDTKGFHRLAVGKTKFFWVAVKDAATFSCQDGRVHQ